MWWARPVCRQPQKRSFALECWNQLCRQLMCVKWVGDFRGSPVLASQDGMKLLVLI
jgi:hypothetical protein